MTPLCLPRSPRGYITQPKLDGWALVLPGDGTAWTRRGKEITSWECFKGLPLKFPYPLHAELMHPERTGSHQVSRLKKPGIQPKIIVHDAMVEGVVLEDRLQIVREMVNHYKYLSQCNHYYMYTWAEVNLLIRITRSGGNEGVVLKEKGSPYHIGKCASVELPIWYKVKEELIHE